jgi:hypothetical protein
MSTAAGSSADVRFLRRILVSLILCTLVSGGICIELARAHAGFEEVRIAARL